MLRALVVVIALISACTSDGDGGGGSGPGSDEAGSGGEAGPDDATAADSSGGGGGTPMNLGPDLDAPVATPNEVRCSDGFPIQINPTFPQPFYMPGAQSCLLLAFVANPEGGVTTGTAVSARIRVGAVTGPMRFVRMRILYKRTTGPECCSIEEYGEEFTPTANAITEVPLGFRMLEEPIPAPNDLETIASNDLVALEVLAPDVPIPGFWTNNGGQDAGVADYLWLPSLSEQGVPAPSNMLLNYTAGFSGLVPFFTISYVED